MKRVLKHVSAAALGVVFALLGVEVLVKFPCSHGAGVGWYVAPGAVALALNVLWMAVARRVAWGRVGAFASWAAPEGGVWKMAAGAIVALDPGTWVAVRELGKLVLRGRDDRDPRDGRDGESVVEGGKAGGMAGARRDGDERDEVTR